MLAGPGKRAVPTGRRFALQVAGRPVNAGQLLF
jgi:hypothetical protein